MPPSLNFLQLDFVKPLSGFHPVTWERVSVCVCVCVDVVQKFVDQGFFVQELFSSIQVEDFTTHVNVIQELKTNGDFYSWQDTT